MYSRHKAAQIPQGCRQATEAWEVKYRANSHTQIVLVMSIRASFAVLVHGHRHAVSITYLAQTFFFANWFSLASDIV